MSARPILDNYNSVSLAPTNKAYSHMYPKYTANEISFEVHNVPSSIANGIRRVICAELLVKGLDCTLGDINTTDVFHIHEMIQGRIRAIPTQQSVKVGTVFKLAATNDTHELITVYSKDLRSADRVVAFNENIPLFTLGAGTSITLQCHVAENYGFNKEFGAYVAGVNAVSLSLDDITTPASNSSHTNWLVRFVNNGTATGTYIIKRAISTLIERLQSIDLTEFVSEGGVHVLSIPNETKTIARLLMQQVLILYPECTYVTALTTKERIVVLRIQCDDPVEMLSSTIKSLVNIYKQLNTL